MPAGPPGRLRYLCTSANGQVALGAYGLESGADRFLPVALDVLTLSEAGIADVIAFRTPGVFARFGLPDALAA